MYTTYKNQIERQLDRQEEEEEVATDRCIQHRTIDREEEEVRTYRCIQHRIIDREILRQSGGEGGSTYRQIDTTQSNRQRDTQIERRRRRQAQVDVYNIEQQIERQLDREEEEEEVATDRCTQHRTIEREEGEVGTDRCIQHRTIDRQRNSQIERRRRKPQIDVYNIY